MEELPEEVYMDLVLLNGKIVTVDSKGTVGEAIAVKGENVVTVGSTEKIKKLVGSRTKVVDLKGKLVLPGFIDSHVHPSEGTRLAFSVDCRSPPNESIQDILERIEAKVKETPEGEWVRGWGYDDKKLREKRHPTRWDLDKVSPNNPVYIRRTDAHLAVVNSEALQLAEVTKDTPDPPGGKIDRDPETGEPTGVLRERAQHFVRRLLPQYGVEEIKEGLRVIFKQYLEWGITTVHDAIVTPDSFKAYQDLKSNDELPLRVGLIMGSPYGRNGGFLDFLIELGLKTGFGDNWLRVIGSKFVCDGSMSGWTAALYEPYENEPDNRGILTVEQKVLTEGVVKSHVAGLRPCIHAIGDRAIDVALNAIEAALKEKPEKDHRMRIEHCGLPDINRLKKIGAFPSSSIGFIYELGDAHQEGIGPERAKKYYPHRTYIEEGIIASGNSDCPVVFTSPLRQIYGCATRKTRTGQTLGAEAQSVSVMDAIKVYTINGAYASFEEDLKGSLEPGKLADMVIVDRDILTCDLEETKEATVLTTIVGGKVVYQKT